MKSSLSSDKAGIKQLTIRAFTLIDCGKFYARFFNYLIWWLGLWARRRELLGVKTWLSTLEIVNICVFRIITRNTWPGLCAGARIGRLSSAAPCKMYGIRAGVVVTTFADRALDSTHQNTLISPKLTCICWNFFASFSSWKFWPENSANGGWFGGFWRILATLKACSTSPAKRISFADSSSRWRHLAEYIGEVSSISGKKSPRPQRSWKCAFYRCWGGDWYLVVYMHNRLRG